MDTNPPAPGTARAPVKPVRPATPARAGINWFRFWIQMLVAMMVFNVIAGLITWYFIFPRLHPAH